MNIVEQIKKDVLEKSDWYKEQDEGHYDFWENHIKYVYKEAVGLAKSMMPTWKLWNSELYCTILR